MGNFSRFVRPGAVRLDVEGITEIDGLMLSAYRNVDGTTAIVAINYSQTDRSVSIKMKGCKHAAAYRTSDAEGENLKHIGRANLRDAILPARSVTTFITEK